MSTIADSHGTSRLNPVSVRAFLAGGGATTALTAAALVAFLTIAALVAFDGLPFGDGPDAGSAQIAELPTSGAPEAAVVAVGGGGAPAAVAASPAEDSAVLPAPAPTTGPGDRGSGSTITAPPGDGGSAPGTSPPGGSTGSQDALGGTVSNLEGTAGNLGLDVPLGDLTNQVTQPLDRTLNKTLNDVGGVVGNPKLGDQVGSGVNGLTGKVNDLTGKLLR